MRVKKSEKGSQIKPTADSTGYYSRKLLKSYGEKDFAGAKKASDAVARQSKKGKPGYDANGFPIKKKMKDGGSLKPVDAGKNPGLAKLPKPVRNKMGYQKDGGKLKAKAGVSVKKKAMGGAKMMKDGGKCKYGC
jgi:hypothetical protein